MARGMSKRDRLIIMRLYAYFGLRFRHQSAAKQRVRQTGTEHHKNEDKQAKKKRHSHNGHKGHEEEELQDASEEGEGHVEGREEAEATEEGAWAVAVSADARGDHWCSDHGVVHGRAAGLGSEGRGEGRSSSFGVSSSFVVVV